MPHRLYGVERLSDLVANLIDNINAISWTCVVLAPFGVWKIGELLVRLCSRVEVTIR